MMKQCALGILVLLLTFSQTPAITQKGPTQAELNNAQSTTDWLFPNHDYGGQRFVDLKQINRQNAGSLRPVSMYQVGDFNPFHANPLVYQGVMYITTASATVALDAVTCKVKWRYDWDQTQVSPLFTTTVKGKQRKLVTTVGKNGIPHVLDRETQEHLYEVPVTTRSNVGPAPTLEGVHVCPGVVGGVEWNGPAYNPGTNTLYVPAIDRCTIFKKADELRYVEDQLYMGGGLILDPIDKARGWLTAIDASTGQIRWRYQSSKPMLAAVTTTSAELIFTGELSGDCIVLDARNGKVLYRFNTGGRMNGGVVTYSVNGKQYVAVASSNASWFWDVPPGSATIIVFALP